MGLIISLGNANLGSSSVGPDISKDEENMTLDFDDNGVVHTIGILGTYSTELDGYGKVYQIGSTEGKSLMIYTKQWFSFTKDGDIRFGIGIANFVGSVTMHARIYEVDTSLDGTETLVDELSFKVNQSDSWTAADYMYYIYFHATSGKFYRFELIGYDKNGLSYWGNFTNITLYAYDNTLYNIGDIRNTPSEYIPGSSSGSSDSSDDSSEDSSSDDVLKDLIERDITTIDIPAGTTCIGNYAFYECTSLATVSIPNSVCSIGAHAFNTCVNLLNITLPNSVWDIGANAFNSCVNLLNITLPSIINSIGEGAFRNCVNLLNINIPNTPTIGAYAFTDCGNLTITIENTTPWEINSEAFNIGNKAIVVPKGTVFAFKADSLWKKWESIITDGRTITMTGLEITADNVEKGQETQTTVHYTATYNYTTEDGTLYENNTYTGETTVEVDANTSDSETISLFVSFILEGMTAATIITHGPISYDVVFGSNNITGNSSDRTTISDSSKYTLYKFIPDTDDTYIFRFTDDITGGSKLDTCGVLLDASMNTLASNDDTVYQSDPVVTYSLTSGNTYYYGIRPFDLTSTANIIGNLIIGRNNIILLLLDTNYDGVSAPISEAISNGIITVTGYYGSDAVSISSAYIPKYYNSAYLNSIDLTLSNTYKFTNYDGGIQGECLNGSNFGLSITLADNVYRLSNIPEESIYLINDGTFYYTKNDSGSIGEGEEAGDNADDDEEAEL